MIVKLTEENHVLTVLLYRPEVRNAFNAEMIEAITQAFLYAGKNKDLRAVVLKGEGKVFSAGADLNWMKDMINFSFSENEKDAEKLFEMFEAMYDCSCPIIGCVQGAAFGGGLGLVALCDYVITENNTQFCFSEVKMGLAPAVISAFILNKLSPSLIAPWMLNGKVFHAHHAYTIGLVHDVISNNELDVKLAEIIKHFKSLGPEAVRETKKLIQKLNPIDWSKAKELCVKTIAERRVSDEGQEGLKSFFAKQAPSWSQNE